MKTQITLFIMAVVLLCVVPAAMPAATDNEPTAIICYNDVSPVLEQQTNQPLDVKNDQNTTKSDTATDPWKDMLTELMNQVAAYAVPLLLTLLFGWLGKKLGFDIPDALKSALEAFIFKVLAQIKAEYGTRNMSNQDLQRLASEKLKALLPNNLMKYLKKKYGSVEGAIEYYYPRWIGLKAGK